MPKWTDLAKIHEGCGGVVRWVEAIDRPGVGFAGECRYCGREHIVEEEIVPVRTLDPVDALRRDRGQLALLEWDHEQSWDENQTRFAEELDR